MVFCILWMEVTQFGGGVPPVVRGSLTTVVESDIYCRIWCHMFVKTVRTVRLRYAFTQIVMIRSHFHCRNTVSKYWYFSETTQSFQLTSHPTQAAYGGWLETGGLTQVYATKTTQITFFQVGKWDWRTMSIKPKILRHLKCAKVHFWSKFGNLR